MKIESMIAIGLEFKYVVPGSAMKYYELVRKTAEEKGKPFLAAKANNAMGGVHYILGAYDFSLDHFYKGQQLYKSIGNTRGIAISYNNIALIQHMQD